jgi:electron transfer flavoprotein beta subunit
MANMRAVMPALQRARPVRISNEGLSFASVTAPSRRRDTRIVKDMPPDRIAREIVDWIGEG